MTRQEITQSYVWKSFIQTYRSTTLVWALCGRPSIQVQHLSNAESSPFQVLLCKAQQLGPRLQYHADGFTPNLRSQRAMGLAMLDVAQKAQKHWGASRSTKHKMTWKQIVDVAVKWRRYLALRRKGIVGVGAHGRGPGGVKNQARGGWWKGWRTQGQRLGVVAQNVLNPIFPCWQIFRKKKAFMTVNRSLTLTPPAAHRWLCSPLDYPDTPAALAEILHHLVWTAWLFIVS